MKFTRAIVLILLLAAGIGCATVQKFVADPATAVSGLTGSNVVAVATNWMGNKAVNDLVNSILTDDALMARLRAAWDQIEAKYAPVDWDSIQQEESAATVSGELPDVRKGNTIVGYGRVNRWANGGSTLEESLDILRADLEACKTYGVKCYLVEFASWGRYSANASDRVWTEAAWKLLTEFCRANGMWVFYSAFNDNQGSGKDGDPGVDLEHSQEMVAWAKGVLKAHGPANVLLQAVAETQTTYGKQLEASMAKEFKSLGWVLVYNRGSRPTGPPSPFDWAAYHPFKLNDLAEPGVMVVSDTGTIIQSLCNGLEGAGKPDVAKAWAKQFVDQGNPLVGFYHFKWAGPSDVATIKALGESAGWSGQESADSPSNLSNVKFNSRDVDVRAWPVTAGISASFAGGNIVLDYDKADAWPSVDDVNANPWVIAKVDGQWHAATFEWFRKGQKSKPVGVLEKTGDYGDHIKVAPLSNWTPKSGEKFGVMVSGLCRDSKRNVSERTPVAELVWP